ncbi:hypothetical protein ABT034_33665 [Streptomyces sp. NPDC002773]|uniref:hypothetical protein n=1 Tax=Streptomyces sp. NPDC002773 TaxID=3154430 RepID=UPI0033219655
MTDQTTTPEPKPTCAWCGHAAHRPGTECEDGVAHGPKRWHRCLCLNLVGADHACHPKMTCQGGTLGYSDVWHVQRRSGLRGLLEHVGIDTTGRDITVDGAVVDPAARTASGQQPECAPCGDTGACNGGPCAHPAAARWTADGRHGPTPEELRQRIARAIHRYDNQHALSGNDVPSTHHYGEADAVLAVLAAIQPNPTTADDTAPPPQLRTCSCGTTAPHTFCPAVGQPAEAQVTDEAPLTASERQFLTFALDQAANELSLGRGFTAEDQIALARLRRMAEEARS